MVYSYVWKYGCTGPCVDKYPSLHNVPAPYPHIHTSILSQGSLVLARARALSLSPCTHPSLRATMEQRWSAWVDSVVSRLRHSLGRFDLSTTCICSNLTVSVAEALADLLRYLPLAEWGPNQTMARLLPLKYISMPVSGVLALSWSGLDTLVSSEARCSSQRLHFFLVVVSFALLSCIILGPRVPRGLLFQRGRPSSAFLHTVPAFQRQSFFSPVFTLWIPRLLSGDLCCHRACARKRSIGPRRRKPSG